MWLKTWDAEKWRQKTLEKPKEKVSVKGETFALGERPEGKGEALKDTVSVESCH